MSAEHLKETPTDCREPSNARLSVRDAWYYEESKGLCVVVRPRDDGRLATQFLIPVAAIRRYLARLDRPTTKRNRAKGK